MIVSYALEHGFGLLFALFVLVSRQLQSQMAFHRGCSRLLGVFHDCAAFLCLSIQIAAMVVLIKEATGISTSGMGDGSVRVTEAISVLTLLPLVYAPVLLPWIPFSKENHLEIQSTPIDKRQQDKRFALLLVCWLLAFYPFYSKLNNVFGPSKISDSAGSDISVEQFGVVQEICFEGVTPISHSEDLFMSALSILAYIPLSLLIIGRILFLGIQKHHDESKFYLRLRSLGQGLAGRWIKSITLGCLGLTPLLACGLLWTIIRVVQFQNELGKAVGSSDADQQWTFGQVVAVLLFTPVLVECWMLFGEKKVGILEKM